jgi:hypothetical protein
MESTILRCFCWYCKDFLIKDLNEYDRILSTHKHKRIQETLKQCENISYCSECLEEIPGIEINDSYVSIIFSDSIKKTKSPEKYVNNILRVNPLASEIFDLFFQVNN